MLADGPDSLDERQWGNSWAAQGTQDQPQDKQPSLLYTDPAHGVGLQQHPDTIPQQQSLQQQQLQQHNAAVLVTSGRYNGTASRLVAAAVGAAAVPSSAAATGAAESGGLPADSAATVQTATVAVTAEQSVLPGTINTLLVHAGYAPHNPHLQQAMQLGTRPKKAAGGCGMEGYAGHFLSLNPVCACRCCCRCCC